MKSLLILQFSFMYSHTAYWEESARDIMASLKRDWMQTGQKLSGVCGDAVLASALSRGYDEYSEADMEKVVKSCESSVTKQIVHLRGTKRASVTLEVARDSASTSNPTCPPRRSSKRVVRLTPEKILYLEQREQEK